MSAKDWSKNGMQARSLSEAQETQADEGMLRANEDPGTFGTETRWLGSYRRIFNDGVLRGQTWNFSAADPPQWLRGGRTSTKRGSRMTHIHLDPWSLLSDTRWSSSATSLRDIPLVEGRDDEMLPSLLPAYRGPFFVSTYHLTFGRKDRTTFPLVACECWFLFKTPRIAPTVASYSRSGSLNT